VGVQCTYAATATPRGTRNVFTINVTNIGGCYAGPAILFYDAASSKLIALASFYNTLLNFGDLWYLLQVRQ
jgi:hypothetical protein